jgi:hypothetical protein
MTHAAPNRTMGWLIPLVVVPWALVHCGGDNGGTALPDGGKKPGSMNMGDSATPPADDDASAPGSDAGTQAPSEDGSTSAPAPSKDAGVADVAQHPPAIPVPEGGAPSDPGSVPCGGAPCAVNEGRSCCIQIVDGGRQETCNPPNTGCPAPGVKLECDEAADCNGGVCCQAIVGTAVQGSTSCSGTPTCMGVPTTNFQVCRTDDECGQETDAGAAKRCIPQTCTNVAPPRSLKIESCAVLSTGFPPIANMDGTLRSCAAD